MGSSLRSVLAGMSDIDKNLRPWIAQLLESFDAADSAYADRLARVAHTHQVGARNLVHYTQLRRQDITRLQAGLAAVGATRLSTAEPDVVARLHGAYNVLDAFAGQSPTFPLEPIAQAFARADDLLANHATELLGPTFDDTHARIMVTLPTEAADDPGLVESFAQAGMELARINCAHDDQAVWAKMIANVRAAADKVGREIYVSMDLAGPKVRTGEIEPGPAVARARVTRQPWGEVITPAKLYLSAQGKPVPAPPAEPGREGLSLQVEPGWLASLAAGALISLTDYRGVKREFRVDRVREDGLVIAYGQHNAYISADTVLYHGEQSTTVEGIKPLEQALKLHVGDTLVLTSEQAPATLTGPGPVRLGCTAPAAVAALAPGHRVLFDDGSISAIVEHVKPLAGPGQPGQRLGAADDHPAPADDHPDQTGHVEATLRITHAGAEGTKLAAFKGINLPDTDIPLPSLTAEDLEAFAFVARHADIAAVSFIRTASDVDFVLDTLESLARNEPDPATAEHIRTLGIVLKIETVPAYEQLPSVLLAGMRHPKLGIMIARGDLAVELGFERMVEVPRLIMQMAEAAHVPVVLATQILENLAKKGIPSRAEITDAGYALRAECVMLNKGPHIAEAIAILDRMSRRLGRSQLKNRMYLRRIDSWQEKPRT